MDLEGVEPQDLILSSMMLHWLPDPRAALVEWRKRLAPNGRLLVAVPVEGSLSEWRGLLRAAGVTDGLWSFPAPYFVASLAAEIEVKDFSTTWADTTAFLQSLKRTGAHQARSGHRPSSPAALRRLLATRKGVFSARCFGSHLW